MEQRVERAAACRVRNAIEGIADEREQVVFRGESDVVAKVNVILRDVRMSGELGCVAYLIICGLHSQ